MADSRFCLAWESHNKNICNGLSSLQQNGEFVDMTIAADGHMVKVHQMVLALASPYIKELISSAQCPHPVIFLNRVSYKTLCSILEYIYTGQAMVAVDDINELIVAAKELHIKGLEDVNSVTNVPSTSAEPESVVQEVPEVQIKMQQTQAVPYIPKLLKRKLASSNFRSSGANKLNESTDNETKETSEVAEKLNDDPFEDGHVENDDFDDNDESEAKKSNTAGDMQRSCSLQYSVSNMGSVQLILNRYLYSPNYRYRDNRRQWRCVGHKVHKCKAKVVTKDNLVIRRMGAHNHPYHDEKILKKVSAKLVYSAIDEAEKGCEAKSVAKAKPVMKAT